MKALRPWVLLASATLLTTVAGVMAPRHAHGDIQFRVTFDQMVQQSQAIVIATCTDRKVVVRNGNLVTHYTMKLQETWKGAVTLDKAGQFGVEELGGRLDGPVPLQQVTPSMANLAVGEQALLFATYPAIPPAITALYANHPMTISPQTLRIFGGRLGHLTVVNHPETGVPLVARMSMGDLPGSPLTAEINKTALSLAKGKISLDDAGATSNSLTPEQKVNNLLARQSIQTEANRQVGAKLDKAAQSSKETRARIAKQEPALAHELFQFEPLSDVKAQVMSVLNGAAH